MRHSETLLNSVENESLNPKAIEAIIHEADKGILLTLGEHYQPQAEETTIAIVELFADLFNAYLSDYKGVAKTIQNITTIVLNRFGNWTISDIARFAYNARFGEYGRTYGKLSEATVLAWLKQYEAERNTEAIRYNHNKQNEAERTKEVAPPEVSRHYAQQITKRLQEAEEAREAQIRESKKRLHTAPLNERLRKAVTDMETPQAYSPEPLQGYAEDTTDTTDDSPNT